MAKTSYTRSCSHRESHDIIYGPVATLTMYESVAGSELEHVESQIRASIPASKAGCVLQRASNLAAKVRHVT